MLKRVKLKIILDTFFLVLLTVSIIVVSVFLFWTSSIDRNIHKNTKSIEKAKKVLKPVDKNFGSPVNILIIGSDKKIYKKGDPCRSDTLMILRLLFEKDRAYLISIPRDSKVQIPDRGVDKINAAYAYGGAELSIKTVKSFTGL